MVEVHSSYPCASASQLEQHHVYFLNYPWVLIQPNRTRQPDGGKLLLGEPNRGVSDKVIEVVNVSHGMQWNLVWNGLPWKTWRKR